MLPCVRVPWPHFWIFTSVTVLTKRLAGALR
jgi:hypothetical protein